LKPQNFLTYKGFTKYLLTNRNKMQQELSRCSYK